MEAHPRLRAGKSQPNTKATFCKRLLNETAPGVVAQRGESVDVD
jgi:hypothetical protein